MKRLPWLALLAALFISVDVWAFHEIYKEPDAIQPAPAAAAAVSETSAEPPQHASLAVVNSQAYAGITTADIPAAPAVPQSGGSSPSSGVESRFKLATVNGLSLADDLKTMYEIKGEPLFIQRDDVLRLSKVFTYEDCSIGMVDGSIQYVVVPASAGKIEIDGQVLPIDLAKLKEQLGTPYFISEDGIVYKNRSNALKLFLDPDTGEITSIHYFHATAE